ncbi:hypothetical protein EC988_003416 [Linderina pennispora]|nr:hypothetical protein EC988_003416 [Linderina pennispora]
MSTIEQKILNGEFRNMGDEDVSERVRTIANEDSTPSDTEDTSPDLPQQQLTTHDGPQTGVKGVIADYRHQRQTENARRAAATTAAQSEFSALISQRSIQASTKTIWTKDDESDTDSIDALLADDDDAQFFDDYKQKRMDEITQKAAKTGLGYLRDATPDEYVETVERHKDVVVVLGNENVEVSARFERFIRGECGKYPHVVFLNVQAGLCGFEDPEVLPIVLVYRNGDLKHNLVRVVDQLKSGAGFEPEDVRRLLERVLEK